MRRTAVLWLKPVSGVEQRVADRVVDRRTRMLQEGTKMRKESRGGPMANNRRLIPGAAIGVRGKKEDTVAALGRDKAYTEDMVKEKAAAWRDIYAKEIDAATRNTSRPDQLRVASPAPLSKRTIEDKRWDDLMGEMPVAGTVVQKKEHVLLSHLNRLMNNPKYRWKREKFVVRDPRAVRNMFDAGVKPELVAIPANSPLKLDLPLEDLPTVFVNAAALAEAGGFTDGSPPPCLAEYFIPQEFAKTDLWMDEELNLRRVAVLVGIKDPAHLGSLIRSSTALGCDAILLIDGCADPYSPRVLDESLAAHVSAGGYPRLHVVREVDGDDPWGILNRIISARGMLPVASATLPEDVAESVTSDSFWRGVAAEGHSPSEAKLCMFFGGERHGLDIDYVRYNLEQPLQCISVSSGSALGLSSPAQSAVLMHSLMEPTYIAERAPQELQSHTVPGAKIRLSTPISREIEEARATGRELELVPVKAPQLKVEKFYKTVDFSSAAYKTRIAPG